MSPEGNAPNERVVVAAVSGGPDSVYLLRKLSSEKGIRVVIGHVNYGTRGSDSKEDQKMVERIGRKYRYNTVIHVHKYGSAGRELKGTSGTRGNFQPGF